MLWPGNTTSWNRIDPRFFFVKFHCQFALASRWKLICVSTNFQRKVIFALINWIFCGNSFEVEKWRDIDILCKNNIQMSWFAERERKNSGTLKEHRNVRRTWKNKRRTFVCVDDTNLIQLKSFWKIMFKVEFAHTVRAAAMMETTKTTI